MANEHGSNRRKAERITFACPVRLNVNTAGLLIDLSEGGALLRFRRPQEPNRQVTLTIEDGDSTIHLAARVVRSTPMSLETATATLARTEYHVAVEFLQSSPESSAMLRDIVEKYRTK